MYISNYSFWPLVTSKGIAKAEEPPPLPILTLLPSFLPSFLPCLNPHLYQHLSCMYSFTFHYATIAHFIALIFSLAPIFLTLPLIHHTPTHKNIKQPWWHHTSLSHPESYRKNFPFALHPPSYMHLPPFKMPLFLPITVLQRHKFSEIFFFFYIINMPKSFTINSNIYIFLVHEGCIHFFILP